LSSSEERLHKQAAVLEQLEKECKELQAELIKSGESSKADLSEQETANKVIVAELRLEGNQQYVTEVKSQNNELVSGSKLLRKTLCRIVWPIPC